MKFQVGNKVNVLAGKYLGQNVIIEDIHINFKPAMYTCRATNGKLILLGENELQSMYAHDTSMMQYEYDRIPRNWLRIPEKPEPYTKFQRADNGKLETGEVLYWVPSVTFSIFRCLVRFSDGYECVTDPWPY